MYQSKLMRKPVLEDNVKKKYRRNKQESVENTNTNS